MQMTSTCGVQARFDGDHIVEVAVPGRFRQKLTGLCGNCDGVKDDYKTAEGVDVRGDTDKFQKIGLSYSVKDGSNGDKK